MAQAAGSCAACTVAAICCTLLSLHCKCKQCSNGWQQPRLTAFLVRWHGGQTVWQKLLAPARPARLPQSVAHSFSFTANANERAPGWQQARLAVTALDGHRGQTVWHKLLAPARPARLPQSVAHFFHSTANAKRCANGRQQPRLAVFSSEQFVWHKLLAFVQPARLPQSVAHSFPASANAKQCSNERQQPRLAVISLDDFRGQTVWYKLLAPARPARLPQSVAHSFPFPAIKKQCANGWQQPRLKLISLDAPGQSVWHTPVPSLQLQSSVQTGGSIRASHSFLLTLVANTSGTKPLAPAQPARLPQSVPHSFPSTANAKQCSNGWQQPRLTALLVRWHGGQTVWHKLLAPARSARLPQSVAHSCPFPAIAKQCANGWQQPRLAFICKDARGQTVWHKPQAPVQPARLTQSVAHSFPFPANAKQSSNGWQQPRLAFISFDARGQVVWHKPLAPGEPERLLQSVTHSFPFSANARQCANGWQQPRLAFISFDGHRGLTVWHTPLAPAPARLPQSVAHTFAFPANAKQCASEWQQTRLAFTSLTVIVAKLSGTSRWLLRLHGCCNPLHTPSPSPQMQGSVQTGGSNRASRSSLLTVIVT